MLLHVVHDGVGFTPAKVLEINGTGTPAHEAGRTKEKVDFMDLLLRVGQKWLVDRSLMESEDIP